MPKPHEFVLKPDMTRPHVVILGAGASRAAFPTGDPNGRSLPLMNDLVRVVGLEGLLERAGFPTDGNFEDTYSRIKEHPGLAVLAAELEQAVRDYFTGMALPDEPTLYDHLILSLRPKDVIATFNWDPFLVQACVRNTHVAKPPEVLFLHGNTAVGLCQTCRVIRPAGTRCTKCSRETSPTPLLYPIAKKDYSSNPLIKADWDTVRGALAAAYVVTIFGYGAPASDAEAVALLSAGWGPRGKRNLEEIEIIDVKPEEELLTTWEGFVHSEHYRIARSFYGSWIQQHPRRTCEAMWSMLMEHNWTLEANPYPPDASWDALWSQCEALLAQEQNDAEPTAGLPRP